MVLTGAGISAESGLKTFRDADGLWEGHRVKEVATPEAFARNPKLVHHFYNLRRAQLREVEPNAAHRALGEFEKSHSGEFLLVTQNVDDLHERGGSRKVIHMHGELTKVRCLDTGEIFDWYEDLSLETPHPQGGRAGRLRPHICWFGEIPFEMDAIVEAVSRADIFIAIGTSGVVYPAAGLVAMTPPRARRILINKDPAENNRLFEEFYSGPAGVLVPKILQGQKLETT